MLPPQLLRPEPEPPGGPGRGVLHEDVGPGHEPAQRPLRLVSLEVEGEGLLGAVQPDEVAGHALHRLVVAASEVAHPRTLDLYDAGAEVGELAGGEAGRDRLPQRNHRHAFAGQHPRKTSAG